MTAQNNAIRTNYIKARIDKKQQNWKRSLCGDRDEMINHNISECSKLLQKEYKIRHDWVENVVYLKLRKKLKFEHTNKWYMYNAESVRKNETHKLLWDFEIKTDHLISAWRPDLIIVDEKKGTCRIQDFAIPYDHWVKLKERKDKYLDLTREMKKLRITVKVTVIGIIIVGFGTVTKGLVKEQEDLEIRGRVETIQTTALLRSAWILRRVLETCGDL